MAETKIQWTDFSVNPLRFGRGHFCQKVSPGCANCYASGLQRRFGMPEFKGTGGAIPMTVNEQRDGALWLDESKLREVLKRKKPTKYFWCDMTDLFGSWVPDGWIDKCFAVMALTPQHTHQVLTKRAERMRDFMTGDNLYQRLHEAVKHRMGYDHPDRPAINRLDLPLPNVWLGVSVEDQQRADERIPLLLQTPAAVRFLSCEPLLSQVILHKFLAQCKCGHGHGFTACPNTGGVAQTCHLCDCRKLRPKIGWVIVGGESGPGARPCQIEWARSLVKQGQAAGVAVFVKQLGANVSASNPCDPIDQFPNDAIPRFSQGPDEFTARIHLRDHKGGDMNEWSEDLRIREFPQPQGV